MNVCLASYQSVMLLKGGPRTQIFQTKEGLEKLGINVSLFDSWHDFVTDRTDIIHLFGANIGTYHLAREIHKQGIPFVVSPIFFSRHNPLFVRLFSAVGDNLRRLVRGSWTDYGIVAEICSWAHTVVPNTEREARLVHEGFNISEEKITIIPNGVEDRFYHATPDAFKNEYGIENFILNVGHIGPERKNVLRLIRALQKVNHPSVIIGRMEDNDYAKMCLKEAKNNTNLLMLDHLSHDSELLASAYAACDVFVLPSQFETPGIAALEAGLAGAKIVITKHGGTENYFAQHAEYVEPTSAELIHHGIITALNKPKSNDLREHIRKEFLWGKVAEKTLQVYRQVLGS
ncbi:MAG TPA: glycosyltransferase family 4 protein [Bacteroidota bacterium]|nr:glycosyltransferase family 4 protein [Bacteroidota bacterium]